MTTYRVLRASDDVIAALGQTVTYDPVSNTWVPTEPASGGGGGGGGGAVDSVNGKTGAVVLSASDVGAATSAQGAKADTAVQPGDLATVATSGAYGDLSGTPTIPSSPGDVGAAPAVHTHTAGDVNSTGASAGEVLTADGSGGAAWAEPSGGGGGGGAVAFPYPPITSGSSAWWAGPPQGGTGQHRGLGYGSLYPLPIGHPVRVTAFRINLTGPGDGTIHAALYGTVDGTDPRGAAKIADLLVGADATSTGDKTATSLTIDLQPGLYWVAILTTGTTAPTFAGVTGGDLLAMLVPKRKPERLGGLEGASGLTSLPATYPNADTWNMNGLVWFGLQTTVIP